MQYIKLTHYSAVAGGLLSLNLAAVHAQTIQPVPPVKVDPISTDRPDFVESSNTIGIGRFQIETSVALERSLGARTTTTPTLFRYGVAPRWELRLETDGVSALRASGTTTSGLSDIALGAKWHLQDGAGSKPSIGTLFHVDLPSGSVAFRGQGARPSARAVFEWELPHDYSLGMMPGVLWNQTPESGRYLSGIFAIVAGKSLTERLRTFVEYSGQEISASKYGGTIATFDMGAAFLLNDTVQLDTVAFWGQTRSTPRLSVAMGISVRY